MKWMRVQMKKGDTTREIFFGMGILFWSGDKRKLF
jgi:hypothetical protein